MQFTIQNKNKKNSGLFPIWAMNCERRTFDIITNCEHKIYMRNAIAQNKRLEMKWNTYIRRDLYGFYFDKKNTLLFLK